MNSKEVLTSWIKTGDTQRVLKGLSVICKKWGDKDLASDISFQSGRYHDLQTQQDKRAISQADYHLESAKIRQALVNIVNSFPNHWTSEGLETITPTKNFRYGINWKKWVAIIAGAVAFSGAIAEFSGYSLRDIFKKTEPAHIQTAQPSIVRPPVNITTSGDRSPAINAPNGDVDINYNESTPTQKTAKKDSLSSK